MSGIDMATCASCRRGPDGKAKRELVDVIIDGVRVRMCTGVHGCHGNDFKIAHVQRRLRGEAT